MNTRIFTGLKPTGRLQAGNYFGAVRPLLAMVGDADTDLVLCVADLHAMTVAHSPGQLTELTFEMAATLLACADGRPVDVFVQSSLPVHTELSYLLECVATFGEMSRMVQFRQRADTQTSLRLSLLTYPVLMAADVLAHQADVVPVGDDQRQHMELVCTLAQRFNTTYGDTFTVPRGVTPPVAARLKDLRDPTAKMGKSGADVGGVIFGCDPPDVIAAKVRVAVTDNDRALSFDPLGRPGVANLAVLLAECTGEDPGVLLDGFDGAASLKRAVTDALIETFAPIRARSSELSRDRCQLLEVLAGGRDRVAPGAYATVQAARTALGLVTI